MDVSPSEIGGESRVLSTNLVEAEFHFLNRQFNSNESMKHSKDSHFAEAVTY